MGFAPTSRGLHRGRSRLADADEATREQLIRFTLRDPVVAQGFDVSTPGFDLVAFGLE
jgi:hypothetical protein